MLRVIGLYGLTGASLPGFDAVASRVSDEGRLVSWVRAQLVLGWDKGWYPLVGGDLNSITSLFLDCWGGSHVARPSSLACVLASEGLVDAFRHRHATLCLLSPIALWLCQPTGYGSVGRSVVCNLPPD